MTAGASRTSGQSRESDSRDAGGGAMMLPPKKKVKHAFSSLFEESPREFVGHSKKVHSVAWNCTGSLLASGSVDRTAKLWALDSRGQVGSSV